MLPSSGAATQQESWTWQWAQSLHYSYQRRLWAWSHEGPGLPSCAGASTTEMEQGCHSLFHDLGFSFWVAGSLERFIMPGFSLSMEMQPQRTCKLNHWPPGLVTSSHWLLYTTRGAMRLEGVREVWLDLVEMLGNCLLIKWMDGWENTQSLWHSA